METKAIHGLAEPDEFNYPLPHKLWTPQTYDAFNLSKAVELKEKPGNSKTNVPPPKEAPM